MRYNLEARAALTDAPEKHIGEAGPFFTHFVYERIQSDSHRHVREGLVEHLLESWAQEVDLAPPHISSEARLMLSLHGSTLSFVKYSPHGAGTHESLEFDITETTGAPVLARGLSGATITSDQGLILGHRGEPLRLGPFTLIAANEIAIEAESMTIESSSADTVAVVLAASTLTANYLTRVDAFPGALALHVEDPPARLRSHKRTLATGVHAIPYEDFVDLRAVLTSFRPSVHGPPSVYWEKLERGILKENVNRRKIFESLTSRGVIYKEGTLHRLNLNELRQLGFGLAELKSGEPGPDVLRFLAECRYHEKR